ncbi:MAG TPA: histidine kinase [Chitinophagaceae bacterium]|nr:histidine kinase [Chitinophagaceae bacterium]
MLSKSYKYYWWCQIAGWGFVGLSLLFFAFTFGHEVTDIFLARTGLIILAGIITTHSLRWVIHRFNWLLLPIEKVLPKLVVAVIISSIVCSLLVMVAVDLFQLRTAKSLQLEFAKRLVISTLDNGLFLIPWVLIYYTYHYVEKSRRQQVSTLKLESLVKELELKTIKSHINPHFIFNALNSIRALIDENPERARNAITELSNILRSSMQAEKMETVSFEKELNIVKDYLALEHIRFEDRLKVEYEIDEDTLDQPVPPMMLQTLVENAIKHGVSKQMTGGLIKISSDFKGAHHELVILNTGRLNGHLSGDGFGLVSTRNRLQLLFGEKANFEIKEIGHNMVEAKVLIPVDLK